MLIKPQVTINAEATKKENANLADWSICCSEVYSLSFVLVNYVGHDFSIEELFSE